MNTDIAGPSNHFTSDVPVENFFALYRTAREFGTYPLPTENGVHKPLIGANKR